MELSHSLIVALMYVTILSFGLASLLTSLSMIIRRGNDVNVSVVHLNWILILAIAHFNMTWQTVVLTTLDTWTYYAFIVVLLGPTFGFFAANILAPSPSPESKSEDLIKTYMGFKRPFLILFSALQIWTLAADLIVGRGLTGSLISNIVLLIVAIFLYTNSNYKVHRVAIVSVWLIYIAAIALRAAEIIE